MGIFDSTPFKLTELNSEDVVTFNDMGSGYDDGGGMNAMSLLVPSGGSADIDSELAKPGSSMKVYEDGEESTSYDWASSTITYTVPEGADSVVLTFVFLDEEWEAGTDGSVGSITLSNVENPDITISEDVATFGAYTGLWRITSDSLVKQYAITAGYDIERAIYKSGSIFLGLDGYIHRLGSGGASLTWTLSKTDFNGKFIIAGDYIYALLQTSTSTGNIEKYNMSGTLISSAALDYYPVDISTDGTDLFVCGGQTSATDSGGVIKQYDSDLTEQDSISKTGIKFLQIVADRDNRALFTVDTDGSDYTIRRYTFIGDGGVTWSQDWTLTDFADSTTQPHIHVQYGRLYACGKAMADSWASAYDPPLSYWQCSVNCSYDAGDGVFKELGPGMIIEPASGATWQENYQPSKIRVQTTDDPTTLRLYAGSRTHENRIVDSDSYTSLTEIDIDWSGHANDDICNLDAYGASMSQEIHDIEFYTQTEADVIAIIDTDGTTLYSTSLSEVPAKIVAVDETSALVATNDGTVARIDLSADTVTWTVDTDKTVNCFLLGADGRLQPNLLQCRLLFKHPEITIVGTQTNKINSPGAKLVFASNNITVTGHETIVTSPGAAMRFSSGAAIFHGEYVTSPCANMVFASNAAPAGVANDPGAALIFGGHSGIAVTGYKTVVTSPGAKFLFKHGTHHINSLTPPETIYGQFVNDPGTGLVFSADEVSVSSFNIEPSERLTLFTFTLTGAADGLADVEIPITSFQMRLYSDAAAYLQVTIPGADYIDSITSRPQGSLILYMAYASVGDMTVLQKEQIIAVAMDTPRVNEGTINNSITLSGHETDAQAAKRQAAPKAVTLGNSWYNYRRTTGSSITARMVKPHIYLQAGDTVTDDDGTFEVDRITWMKSESVHHMEITGVET